MEKQNCGPENFRGEPLHQIDGDYIRAKLVLPGGGEGLKITKIISKELIDKARDIKQKGPFIVSRFITYFKVEDGDQLVTKYEILLKYSSKAWRNGYDPDLGRPRVAYLVLKNSDWAAAWVEFPAGSITFTEPPDQDSHGFVCINVDGLEDPLIGGL
ncbi:MAG: hypothetical protein MUO54_13180 [Anaerolineales bacterium]|nr:hypothetical protein [Anaerolineales bacterium]